jgi:hypothetical protein
MGNYKVGDHVQVKLSGGRIAQATIKVVERQGACACRCRSVGDSVDLSVVDRHRGSLIDRAPQSLKNGVFDGRREI